MTAPQEASMIKPATLWIKGPGMYDPGAPIEPVTKEPEKHYTDHHLIYAALLDGVLGCERLSHYTGLHKKSIQRRLHDLAGAGYIKKVNVRGRRTHVPLGMNSPLLPD